ncbi:Heparinase II/III-like protein [Novipirellula aureliae]|uniref:Heparinase II/III-like protein n=1 Tax=Novipirellula aureliae TaxID=2527966 RepID=A0A5C6DTR5_9BACT|nr:heparinase II/III family protein [Novipirellula aureliae]TWU38891.1 Heparinase II/III-like protein [Novipirellula aureliae]
MFQRLNALAAVAAMMCVVTSCPAVTPDEMSRAIPEKLDHPYLYFSAEDIPDLQARTRDDEVCKSIYTRLLAKGQKLLTTEVETTAPREDKNPRYTGDWSYHKYIDRNWDSALTLAFLYQMTGEAKYAEKSFEFADVVCDVTHWEDRAHQFPIIYSRVMPWNVPDDQVVFNYDLYTAHTAHAMSLVYDWIYDWMNVRQRDRIRGALLEKAILRVRGNWDYHWWAHAYRCNWVAHCSSGAGLASMALLTEDPQLIDVVAESYNRVWRCFDEIGIDGGWQEGTGYSRDIYEWAVKYGMPLKRMTSGEYTLLNHPKINEHPVSFLLWTLLPPNQKVDFGDTGSQVIRKSAVFNVLAEETGSAEAAWYAKNICASDRNSLWDIIFPVTTVEPALPEMKSRHFRTIDYVVMRSSFTDTETVTLYCKAGRHTDPHHGHLDCGDWGVNYRGEIYIRGIGNIPYDEKCFDDVRWTYPQAGSQGQNVIFVNGEKQIPGKWRGKPMDESIGGDVLEYRYGDEREYMLMDGTNAYPKQELKKWRRHFILDKPEVTVVLDEIESVADAKIESRIHPIGDVEIPDDHSYLLLKGRRGNMAVITVASTPIQYAPDRHSFRAEQKNARLRLIPYVDTELNASGTETTISTIVLPVEDANEARAVAESVKRSVDDEGGLTLSFAAKGQTHTYHYQHSDDGLVLAQQEGLQDN